MPQPIHLQTLTDSQRQFVTGAESMGATSPARARKGAELPRISARELEQLLDSGIIREAAEGSYYMYPRARPAQELAATPLVRRTRSRRQRLILGLIFWIVVMLVPILMLFIQRPR